MPGGRPPKYKTPEELADAIDWYFFEKCFDSCGNERLIHKPVTVSGLAYYLGFADRQSITDYQNKDEFTFTIKRAKIRIENYLEEKLSGNNVTGTIFNLKNNFGWKDKTEQEVSVKSRSFDLNFVSYNKDDKKE